MSFGISGEQVDGMDVRAVKAAGEKAADFVRSGNGPFILEMLTYRYRGHSMSDPAKYRTRDEVKKVREEHDPIEQVRVRLIEAGQFSEEGLKEVDKEVRAVVDRLDLHDGFIGLDLRDHIACLDLIAFLDQPFDECALLHGGRQGWHQDFVWHLGNSDFRVASGAGAGDLRCQVFTKTSV